MSLGGQEDSAAVIVYGPDGKAYGSPAQARAAGVSNPTMSPPAGIPISYPGRQPYTPAPLPGIPTQSSGGRNRYAEIMAQYQQAQPFSFTGYPSSYTGGYDVSQPQAYAAPSNRYEEIMAQGTRSGPGGRPVDYNPEWTAKTDAEKADFYAQSPFFSNVTQLGQNIFGYTLPGMLQKNVLPDFVARQKLIAQGINPDGGSGDPTAGREIAGTDAYGSDPSASFGFVQAPGENRGGFVAVTPQQAAQAAADASAAPSTPETQAVQNAINNTDFSGMDRGGGGGGGGYSGAPSGGSDVGRSAPGSAHYAQGGHVSMQHLQGPDPEGPDDGYAALKDGEYVINDKAVKKYGIELMNLINSGKISKGKLRGLLEM